MPPVSAAIAIAAAWITTAIVGATGASMLAAAVIYTVVTFTLKTLLMMAVTAAASMLTSKPKNQSGNINQGAELQLKLDPAMPRQLVVGINATGGSVVWAHTHTPAGSKVPNEVLKRVIALSDYPVHSLLHVKKGTEFLFFADDLDHGVRTMCTTHFLNKSGTPRMFITFYNGSQTTADPTMLAGAPGLWTANHIGRGVAYVVVEYWFDPDAFTSGEPELTYVLKGVPCYDDRKDGSKPGRTGSHRLNNPATWEWTDNAGVIAAQVMRGWRHPYNPNVLMYGVQADERDLSDSMLLSAFNTCDQPASRFDTTFEPRYRANLMLNCAESHSIVLQDLQSAMDGRIIDRGGAITLRPGATHTPILDFSDNDIVWTEQRSWQPKASIEELTNYITGTFVDGEGLTYSEKSFPTQFNTAWEADDGDQRFITQVSFRAIHSWGQVQRVTKRMHAATRFQATIAFVVPIAALEIEQGDWFTMTSDRWGFTDKYFEVQQMYITQDLKCAIIGRETDPDIDIWDAASDEKPRRDTTWNPTTPDVPIPIFVLTPTTITQGDIKIPAIIFYQEDSLLAQETQSIEVQVCLTADEGTGPYSFMPLFPATEGSTMLPGSYLPDEDYSVRARNIGNDGRTSEWSDWEQVTTDPDFFINLIEGLGDLATQDQVDWASQVTGVSKPENDATKSHVYRQIATPSTGLSINDIWVQLNGSSVPIAVWAWNGSAWIKGADITGVNTAAGIVGQGALATLSFVDWATRVTGVGKPDDFANKSIHYKQQTTPSSPGVNDIWTQLDGVGNAIAIWAYNGSIWINGADRTVYNTSAGIIGQGAWATATVPSGLTPTQVNGRTQYFNNSDGKLYDYRGVLFGYSIDGVAGRTTQPLTSGPTTVSVAAHSITFPSLAAGGTASISIPSNSFSGLSNDTTYSVFFIPGAAVWSAVVSGVAPAFYSSIDGWLYIGAVRTQTSGGTYNPPPYGSGGSIDYCVWEEAWVSDTVQAKDVQPGQALTMMTQAGDELYVGYVTGVSKGKALCVKIRTASEGELTVSLTAPIVIQQKRELRTITAEHLRPGMMVPHHNGLDTPKWDFVTEVTLVGELPVVRISAGDGIFAATNNVHATPILTHNGYNKP